MLSLKTSDLPVNNELKNLKAVTDHSTTLKIATTYVCFNNTGISNGVGNLHSLLSSTGLNSNVEAFLLLHGNAQNGIPGHRLTMNFD